MEKNESPGTDTGCDQGIGCRAGAAVAHRGIHAPLAREIADGAARVEPLLGIQRQLAGVRVVDGLPQHGGSRGPVAGRRGGVGLVQHVGGRGLAGAARGHEILQRQLRPVFGEVQVRALPQQRGVRRCGLQGGVQALQRLLALCAVARGQSDGQQVPVGGVGRLFGYGPARERDGVRIAFLPVGRIGARGGIVGTGRVPGLQFAGGAVRRFAAHLQRRIGRDVARHGRSAPPRGLRGTCAPG
ncbi:hypothetical protein, partial [Paracidovorax cattleyae]|uniref:hypothetical protein n=1 Tax=Paracidovorax cattleyae TaxID=80868 RepID=UPI001E44234F